MPRKKKKSSRRIIKILIAIVLVIVALFLVFKTYLRYQPQKTILSSSHISFDVPKGFSTISKSYGETTVNTIFKISAFAPGSSTKEVSDFKNSDIKVVYSVIRPWTPNTDNIPSASAFEGTGKTTKLDSHKILPANSILKSNQVTIYTYLIGDDSGHNRGKYGVAYQGDVRLDFATTDHVSSSEAIFFKCVDPRASTNASSACASILSMFLGSLRLVGAKAQDSPPSFETQGFFESIPSLTRHFDSEKKVLPTFFLGKPDMTFPYFSPTLDNELLTLPDASLVSMRCMPQQLYTQTSDTPRDLIPHGDSNSYSIRTTDGNNLYYKVYVTDPTMLNLISKIKSIQGNSELKNFFACQTDDGGYVFKYNRIKYAPYKPGDQSVNYLPEQALIAEIAVIDPKGIGRSIASIPLPNRRLYCEEPLALTKDNIFYLACQDVATLNWGEPNGRFIYRIDLANKSYSLLSACNYSYSGDDLSKPVTPITSCK